MWGVDQLNGWPVGQRGPNERPGGSEARRTREKHQSKGDREPDNWLGPTLSGPRSRPSGLRFGYSGSGTGSGALPSVIDSALCHRPSHPSYRSIQPSTQPSIQSSTQSSIQSSIQSSTLPSTLPALLPLLLPILHGSALHLPFEQAIEEGDLAEAAGQGDV